MVQAYDLVILDLNLPGEDGLTILKGLRARRRKIPVLVITARSAVDERIQCARSRRRRLPDQAVRLS